MVVDDHLLRDLLVGDLPARLAELVGDGAVATTNLYYTRLCKSAAAARGSGRLVGGWPEPRRRALMGALVALPDDIITLPLRELAWSFAELSAPLGRLSLLGAEAAVAARALDAVLCVAADDEGPNIRAAAQAIGVGYAAIER